MIDNLFLWTRIWTRTPTKTRAQLPICPGWLPPSPVRSILSAPAQTRQLNIHNSNDCPRRVVLVWVHAAVFVPHQGAWPPPLLPHRLPHASRTCLCGLWILKKRKRLLETAPQTKEDSHIADIILFLMLSRMIKTIQRGNASCVEVYQPLL